MTYRMKHIFIINSASGSKRKRKKFFNHIIETCKNEKIDYDIYFTKAPGDACQYAREIALTQRPVRFYACGGDGTVNELAAAVAGIPTAQFTAVPLGSGNDFIRNFGTKSNFLDLVSLIYGRPVTVDLMKINDRYCANIANIGFDRRVVSATNRIKKSRVLRGQAAYFAGVLLSLFFLRKELLHFTFEDGSQSTNRLLLTLFANGSYYGSGFKACSQADLCDGLFDLMIVPPVGRLKFISLLGQYRKGNIMNTEFGKNKITYKKCRELFLSRATPIKYCLDGEILSAKEIRITMEPQAACFVIPADVTLE